MTLTVLAESLGSLTGPLPPCERRVTILELVSQNGPRREPHQRLRQSDMGQLEGVGV